MSESRASYEDETLAATGDDRGEPRVRTGTADALAPGEVLGRYLVVTRIGAGGMGIVYAAYDPELDRKVALKVLHPDARGGSSARARMMREAQALARLSHPGIVAVHDVGAVGDCVWIAMELVSGQTLRQWQDERRRSWREVLAVMLAAGQGLAAAHETGLLHRDFKPDNVMVGSDGRVRVMDFGLARAAGSAEAEPTSPSPKSASSPRPFEDALTRAGALTGTPAYMAPEQLEGVVPDARADQFAFCVTLWEALFRGRPFAGRTLAELSANLLAGRIVAPARDASVPSWLRRACARGLALERERRWPSMRALLGELARGQSRTRARRLLGATGVVVVAGAGLAGLSEIDEKRQLAACEAEGAEIEEIWNDPARTRVREALLATEVSYAAITAEKAMPWLDTHVRAWGEARRELCLDARVRGTVDDAALERALWCLDDRRIELEALVEELAHADAPLIRHAVRAAVGLSRIETCRDAGLLRRLPLPPPRLRSEARTASVELLRAGALERAGRFDDARTLVQAAADRADGLGWPPLAAAVRVQLGSLLEREGRYAEAEAAFEAAYFEAATAGAAQTAADAADRLTFTVGYRLSRHAEGLRWSRLAEVELERLGTGEDLRRAEHLDFLVPTLHGMGDYSQAGATAERVLAIREPLLGPDHPDVGSVLDNIGISRHQAGELQQARELHERAIEIARRALGPEHPDVAMSLHNLALVYRDLGDRDGARARYEESLAVAERALGPDHVDVAQCLDGLASTHYAAGEYEQARALYERALAITEKSLGPDHPQVATSLASLGAVARMTGDLALAQRRLERALAIRERAFGGEHPQVAATLNSLGVVAVDQGDVARGRRLHERALTIREKALGPGHLEVAASLMNVASVHRAAGDWVAMVAPLERAVAIYAAHEGAQPNELKARFALAEALVASGGDGTRARALAQGAREGWLAGAQADPAAVAKVDTWLAAHARRSPDAE